jgi:predicted RNA binding protein YcfA (HicA-like mRNA interferase family)
VLSPVSSRTQPRAKRAQNVDAEMGVRDLLLHVHPASPELLGELFCEGPLVLPCLPDLAALRYASALYPTMARTNKLLDQILRGGADANIPFSGMVQLLKRLGFQERIKGSHHIFSRDGVAEILNLQPHSGKCKPYQVKQVRNVIINYRLAGEAGA